MLPRSVCGLNCVCVCVCVIERERVYVCVGEEWRAAGEGISEWLCYCIIPGDLSNTHIVRSTHTHTHTPYQSTKHASFIPPKNSHFAAIPLYPRTAPRLKSAHTLSSARLTERRWCVRRAGASLRSESVHVCRESRRAPRRADRRTPLVSERNRASGDKPPERERAHFGFLSHCLSALYRGSH